MALVLLDLNYPDFQAQFLTLDTNELRACVKALAKIHKMTWEEVHRDPGLKWEQVKGSPGRFTLRITRQARAVVKREGDAMRFQTLHFDHDSAYGKK